MTRSLYLLTVGMFSKVKNVTLELKQNSSKKLNLSGKYFGFQLYCEVEGEEEEPCGA